MYIGYNNNNKRIIGASLSEPHTYRTAVQNTPDILRNNYARVVMHMIIMNVTCTWRYCYLTPHEHNMILDALGIMRLPLLLYSFSVAAITTTVQRVIFGGC